MTNLKTYFKELFEADNFKARSKESGKLVQFKSKDAYNAALKAGTHEDPKAPKSKADDKGGPKTYGMKKKSFFGNDTEDGPDPVDTSKKAKKINIFDKPSKSKTDDKGGPKSYGMKKKSFFGNDTEDGPDPVDTSPKPDTQGDKFELGTPAVYTDNGKEYSGEVVMNPSNQRVQINGQWTTIGKGTVKGIQTYGSGEFIVPDNWNDAKSFDDSMEEPAAPAQPKQQRKGNPQVNKEVKGFAEKEGFTPSQLGNQEYKTKMLQAAVSALSDANFHDEARELVAKLEGKPEWAKKPQYPSMDDPDFDDKMAAIRTNSSEASKFMQPDGKTWAFGREIAQKAGYDGVDAADGIAFTLRMNGFHKEADAIQSVFDNKPYMREVSLKGVFKETKYYKSNPKVLKEAFNAKDLPNWLFDDPVDFEDWYEDGMKLSNNKGKIAPFSSSDEKKLFQLVGIWQDSEGDYQYGRGDYGTGKTTGARSASYTAQDDIKKFLTQKGKIVDESLNEASEPEVISQLKDIVKNQQYETIKDPKSGKKIKVDMQTANAVLQIYDGLSNVNKDNMVKMGLPKMIEVSYKIISKYR